MEAWNRIVCLFLSYLQKIKEKLYRPASQNPPRLPGILRIFVDIRRFRSLVRRHPKLKKNYHNHTKTSDGSMCLEVLASVLSIFGFTEIAITDHDVLGLDLRKPQHRAIKKFFHYMGVEIIPGIEFSCKFPLGDNQEKEFHIVGLGIYHVNALLMEAIKLLREGREKRAKEMVRLISEAGYKVDSKKINKNINITLLDIAENVRAADGSKINTRDFLEKYLLAGKEFYRPKELLEVKKTIETIKSAGGIASWAHPFTTLGKKSYELEGIFGQFLNFGMEAVEVYTRRQTRGGMETLEELCDRHSDDYKLECFAGSDTHTLLDIFLYVERILELFREMAEKEKIQNGSERFVPYFFAQISHIVPRAL